MKRNHKHEDTTVAPQAEPEMAVLMAKIQEQLAILEKKIDSLISQSSERPHSGEHYSKPFKRFDRFSRHERRDQGNSYGERVFTKAICADCQKECEVPFKPTGDRPVYCKDCFSRRKQGGSFERAFAPRENSDKKPRRKGQERAEKKPVSRRRKERK